MKNALLLSCFLILFSMACVGPTGFLIDDAQKRTFKDIDKLLLVIEVKSRYQSKAKRTGYKKLDLYYVLKYAKGVLEKASGLEVGYTDNKNTDESFILIKIKSNPYCGEYMPGGYRCPGGNVSGNVSLYLKGEKIFYERFYHHEPIKNRYRGFAPNFGEGCALRGSNFKSILKKIGSEIRKYSSM